MSFPRYPKYKDSGVEWLGEVPEHWTRTTTKRVIGFTTGWTPPTDDTSAYDGNNPWANISDLGPKVLCDTAKHVSDGAVHASGMKPSPPGSLLFSFKLSIGQVSFVGKSMYTNEAIATFLPSRELSLRYAYYALPFYLVRNAEENIYGAKLLNQELIRSAPLIVPPKPEQEAIATLLDNEIANIDALISEQQRLIALLKEKRHSIITHAVTRGLNSTAPTRSSGVERLGDVPAHWHVAQLGTLCSKIGSGKTPLGGATTYVDEGVLFIRSQNVYDDGLRLDDVVFITPAVDEEMGGSRTMPGDILLNITGASLGRSCIVPPSCPPANVNQHVCVIRVRDPDLREFVSLALKSSNVKADIDAAQNGAAREGLNYQQIARLVIAVPPVEERIAIAEFISAETDKISALAQAAERSVVVLVEHRSTLISAAVTGEIDVRNYIAGQAEAA